MSPIVPIHIHVAPGFPADLEVALAHPGLIRVDRDDPRAEVWVTRPEVSPAGAPRKGPAATLVVGAEPDTVEWLEAEVDLCAGADELARDAYQTVRQALASRTALRPGADDPPQRWVEAVRVHTGSDAAGRILPGEAAVWAGDAEGLDALWEPPTSIARRSRYTVVVPSAAAVTSRLGLSGLRVDGVVVVPFGPRASDGALILVVAAGGRDWVRTAVPAARAVVCAAMLASAQRRAAVAETERTRLSEAMGRLLAIASHDLRSPLFAVQLGLKVLERQGTAPESLVVLNRASGSATDMLRRVVDAGRAVLEPPGRPTGTADLEEVWARVATEVATQYPGRSVVGRAATPGEPLRVSLEAGVLELLLRTILLNAVIHGTPDAPVRVESSIGATEVVVEVRNPGRLPFADLALLLPFEHRSHGGLGIGLFVARRAADAAGAHLGVRQVEGEVEARLGLRRAP